MLGGLSLKEGLFYNKELGGEWAMGESINIWQHHWPPRKHPPLVVFYMVESRENQMVASLINSST